MKREVRASSKFKTDLKKLNQQERLDVKTVVDKLQVDETLEPKYRDHDLHGNYIGYRECHIRPDLLLVYKKGAEGKLLILTLYRISSHTNIFATKKSKKK